MSSCPNISAVSLDRYLSDHRPILMRESHYDYGPVPFRFFHYWFDMEGFDKLVEDSWKEALVVETNALIKMMKKLKYLKEKIRVWNKTNKDGFRNSMRNLKDDLAELDLVIDKGEGDDDVVNKRTNVVRSLRYLKKLRSSEAAQKEKIKWAIEGDENSKYYHGILNKKRSQLAIRGILVDGNWIESPELVKTDLECQVTKDEIKRAVWDCGMDKSPSPDRFTFDFYRRGSVIVNGSPTEEFQFYKGLKQGDPLSPFLFIVVMKSLHVSFQRVVDADCFHRASGLRINMSKSKLLGIYVDADKVDQAARKIGCVTLKTPFTYLGSKVGGLMSRIQSWNETVEGMATRLSKWKMKTLSIGGVTTYGIYSISFFNGVELVGKKPIWGIWKNVLASKDKGGLGMSSLFTLNRALMFKWVWRFFTQSSSLWAMVIKAIHGGDRKIGKKAKSSFPSIWLDIVHGVKLFKDRGTDLVNFIHKKLRNEANTLFWEDAW
ncbi:hypothetical protein Tco_0514243 [Tanacetum coccineum]